MERSFFHGFRFSLATLHKRASNRNNKAITFVIMKLFHTTKYKLR